MQALELSEIRKNMMKWYPFSEEDTCLVVGDEKGLLRQALEGNVRSIHHVVSGEEPDGEQRYHYILLYDGWNPSILPGLRDRLCPGGRILILTDNRLGLRYLSGEPDPHTGGHFSGWNDYPEACCQGRGYSRSELVRMLQEAGYDRYRFYYPYPDEQIVKEVFTDETIKEFEYGREYYNFTYDTSELFSQVRASRSLVEEGVMAELANAFVVEVCPDGDFSSLVYAKVNSFRRPEFQIATVITQEQGDRQVEKYGLTDEAVKHVKKMLTQGHNTDQRMKETKRGVQCHYYTCKSLDQLVEERIEAQDAAGVVQAVRAFYEPYLAQAESVDYLTKDFARVFGENREGTLSEEQRSLKCICPANIDMICDNIMLTENGYEFIDEEWIFTFPIPVLFILWRCIRELYTKHVQLEDLISREDFCGAFGISPELRQVFLQWSLYFVQEYVGTSLYEKKAVPRLQLDLHDIYLEKANAGEAKLYLDMGEGYSEENSLSQIFYADGEGNFEVSYDLPEQVKELRWAPVKRRWLQCRITECNMELISHNGEDGPEGQSFTDGDPQYVFRPSEGESTLRICGKIQIVSMKDSADRYSASLVRLKGELRAADWERNQQRKRILELMEEIDQRKALQEQLKVDLDCLEMEHADMHEKIQGLKAERDQVRQQLDAILQSRSWKLISFVRKILGR